jgi:hypothetical protein
LAVVHENAPRFSAPAAWWPGALEPERDRDPPETR